MSTAVSEAYPELFHYTTLGGFEGILSSQCLWATDARSLNDSTEIQHYFDARISDVIRPQVRQYAIELARNPKNFRRMYQDGGLEEIVDHETAGMAMAFRQTTSRLQVNYILSLSGPTDRRVAENGLLSQWRGYGRGGGIALVLDTAKVEKMLEVESFSHAYLNMQIADVYYHGIDPAAQPSAYEDVSRNEETLGRVANALSRGGTMMDVPGAYEAVAHLSSMVKHWGFFEEREIRVSAIVSPDPAIVADIGRPAKSVKIRGASVEYVELFKDLGMPLPITRVIVGPHPQQLERCEKVIASLLGAGYKVPVLRSQIPYVENPAA